MGEWKRVKLGEICSRVCSGGTPRSNVAEYYEGGSIPWLNTKEVTFGRIYSTEKCITESGLENSSAKWIEANAVVVAMYGATAGNVAITRIPLTTNQACCNLQINPEKADADFVFYYLKWQYHELCLLANGAAQQNLNAQVIKDFQIDLPDLPTQRRIAAVLGALDDKIEVNRKICENLEAQAQALFKAWFVDFEPFGGKRPEGWKMGKLGDVAEVTSGKRPPTRSDVADGESVFPLLGAAAIMGFTSQYMFDEPILVTGRVGTHGVIQRSFGRSWPSDNTLVIRAKRFEFVYQILKRIDYGKMNRGSTQPLITQSDLKGVEILIPDEALLNQFEEAVEPLMRLQYDKLQESRALAAMRDALLPKLMSGELAVEKVEVK